MAPIAPDMPELQQVPEALRSVAYMRALNRAMRSPLTWLLGLVSLAAGVGIGATQGRAFFGGLGAVLGTTVGAALAMLLFFRVILPWRARRVLPSLTDQTELSALDQVRRADESLRRMAGVIEGGKPRGQKDPRDPTRLP
jgi:hypothetical protein